MGLKNFKEFTSDYLGEKYDYDEYYSSRGKTKFSRFLNKIKGRVDHSEAFSQRNLRSQKYDTLVDPVGLLGNLFGKAVGAVAKTSDYLFKPSRYNKKDQKYRPVTDSEWDEWYSKKVGNEEISDKDVEKFYASGVVSGKKMFGGKFDPASPKNTEEENFMKDLDDATYRIYSKRSKSK